MKKVEIRRHALKDSGTRKDMLSPEGIEQARKAGAEMKNKGYTHVVITQLFRTPQTAAAMAEGAGDFAAAYVIVSPALFTKRMDELVAYVKEHGAVVKPEIPLIQEEARRMADEFVHLVAGLPENAHTLAIGHSPLTEIMILGLTGRVVSPLKECEGVILTFDGANWTIEEEIRL